MIDFTSYSITNGEYKDSYKRKSNGQLIQLYADNKIVCRIKPLAHILVNCTIILRTADHKMSVLQCWNTHSPH